MTSDENMKEWLGQVVAIYGAGKNGATVFAILDHFDDKEEWYRDENTNELLARYPRGKYDVRPYKKKNGGNDEQWQTKQKTQA